MAVCLLMSAQTFAVRSTSRRGSASARLQVLDSIIEDAIGHAEVPGAVVVVGHNGKVIYRKAMGYRALEPRREAMTLDTIFDIASLTKVVCTTTATMQLLQRGEVRLNDPVAKYLSDFAQNGKQDITVRDLLTHFSGLREDLDLITPWQGRDTALTMAFADKQLLPQGTRFLYSDINFIVLGALVEQVSGEPLDRYCQSHIFAPLKMAHTRYLPPVSWIPKIGPTDYDETGKMLRGVVHDPSARRMGGVAGHAGLFSTADDLAKFAQALLTGTSILSPLVIEKMSTPQQPPTAPVLRGLGWDLDSPLSGNRGYLLPVGSFGHTGFTGTSLWIDPLSQTYIVVLSNAVHPRGKGTAVPLRSKIATAVAASLSLAPSQKDALRLQTITGYNELLTGERRMLTRNGSVQTGVDVLEAHNFDLVRGTDQNKRRVGLLTNQTGVDSQGRRTIDVLAQAPGISLDAIFSPEHGIAGTADTTEIGNSTDPATNVPVYSVYGGNDASRRPQPEVLAKLDALVVDLQDAGARFYTYETTVGYFLEAAAKAGIEVIVLDRPNPIAGSFVQGPISESGHESFTNYFSMPLRHGMTLGELAKLFNTERGINARLTVVPMDGWLRGDWYDSTGLAWVNPSPNLRSLTANTLYPGVAMIEGTNVSVGRGTDTPFELLGAPWIKGRDLAAYLNARNIPGVRFVPVHFTPAASVYSGQPCEGVNLVVTDRNGFDAPELGVELAAALHKLYPQQFQMEKMTDLLANPSVYDALSQDQDPRRIQENWQDALQSFLQLRQKYLIYK
ncbi:MAG TPA: exo-beta-N-acetylmuramidase NamZ domain-containing protein [Terriglobales bacterium]